MSKSKKVCTHTKKNLKYFINTILIPHCLHQQRIGNSVLYPCQFYTVSDVNNATGSQETNLSLAIDSRFDDIDRFSDKLHVDKTHAKQSTF